MTNSENTREQEQARVADIVAQTMQLKLHGAAALAVIGTFLGAIIIAISISQAKEVVQPVSDMALENKTHIKHMNHSIEEIKSGQNTMLEILREIAKK